jgi:hypothetical protein
MQALFVALLAVVALVTGLWANAIEVRTLSDYEMKYEARGAAPGDCNSHVSYTFCAESGLEYYIPCSSKSQSSCRGGCLSCSSTDISQFCSNARPWNALSCRRAEADPGGCGQYVLQAECEFIANECACVGRMLGGMCIQEKITELVGPCRYIR